MDVTRWRGGFSIKELIATGQDLERSTMASPEEQEHHHQHAMDASMEEHRDDETLNVSATTTETDEEDEEVDVLSLVTSPSGHHHHHQHHHHHHEGGHEESMFSPGSSSGGNSEESIEEEDDGMDGSPDSSDRKQQDPDDPSKKLYACTDCKYVTDRKNNLKRHIVTMHEECQKALECCDQVFPNKAAMREHVIACHKHGYDCKMCGRNFCRKALLKRHITVHSGQKDYVCQVCGYATSHKSNLDRHKRRHLPKEGPNMLAETHNLNKSRDHIHPHHHHHHLHHNLHTSPKMHMSREAQSMGFASHDRIMQMARENTPLNLSHDIARDAPQRDVHMLGPRLHLPRLPTMPPPSDVKPSMSSKIENDRLALYLQDRYARFLDGKIPHATGDTSRIGPQTLNNPGRFLPESVHPPQPFRQVAPETASKWNQGNDFRPSRRNILPEINGPFLGSHPLLVPPIHPQPQPPPLPSDPHSPLEDEVEQFTYVVGDKEYLSYPLKKRKRLAPSLYTCKYCERVFSNQLQLNLHMESHHVIKKPEPQRPLTLSVKTNKPEVTIFH